MLGLFTSLVTAKRDLLSKTVLGGLVVVVGGGGVVVVVVVVVVYLCV